MCPAPSPVGFALRRVVVPCGGRSSERLPRAIIAGAGARLRPRVCQAAAAPGAHRQRVRPVSSSGIAVVARLSAGVHARGHPKANTVCYLQMRGAQHRIAGTGVCGLSAAAAAAPMVPPRGHFGLCGPRDVPVKLVP